MFSALEALIGTGISETEPQTVAHLTRAAAGVAECQSAETGYEFKNWSVASRAVLKTMLLAGVILDDQWRPIRFGIAAHAARVRGLVDRYRDLTEAYLLKHVIARLGDVTERDHVALAHALFRQFDPSVSRQQMEDRVVELLAILSDWVFLNGNGLYQAVETVSELT